MMKQPSTGDPYSAISIEREAKLYTLIKEEERLSSIKATVPNIIEFDSQEKILIVEYVNDAQSYNMYNYNLPSGDFLKGAYMLGEMIATYHKDFEMLSRSKNHRTINFLPKAFPFNITVIRPGPELLSTISPANMSLLRIIQQYSEILDFFNNLYKDWSIEQTLIHGDMKWDNIIIVIEKSAQQVAKMKIIDWEFAAIGDPAWDIGGVLHDFMNLWIYSLPITGNQNAEKLAASTEYQLDNLKRATRSFWRGYIDASEKASKWDELLIRSTRYCAIRMIQKVYEMHQASSELTNSGIYTIQTSLNMALNIHDAIIHLFGIPI